MLRFAPACVLYGATERIFADDETAAPICTMVSAMQEADLLTEHRVCAATLCSGQNRAFCDAKLCLARIP